jgi:hypothetical protein
MPRAVCNSARQLARVIDLWGLGRTKRRAPGRSTRRVWPGAPTSAAGASKGKMTRPRVKDTPSPPPLLTSLRSWLTRDSLTLPIQHLDGVGALAEDGGN